MFKLASLPKLLDRDIRRKNLRALRIAARERWWLLTRPAAPPPIFIVGCSRSGTTVTYETIAAAPGLRSFGYEIPQFWNGLYGPATNGWHSEAAGAEAARPAFRGAALRHFYARLGRGRVVDKTCINVLRIPFLARLFPDASFVYIHRDGRDNVSSLIDGWRDGRFALNQFLGPAPVPVAIEHGAFDQWHFFLPPGWRDYCRAALAEVCAYQWLTANRLALEAQADVRPERWITIRYEDLLERPEALFREVFARLELEFSPAIRERCASLHERPTSIVRGLPGREKWRESNPAAIAAIEQSIAPMMTLLGYA